MSQIILNVLCEGPTEDRFANHVLKSYLKDFNIVVKTTILFTSKKKNIRGGMLSYKQAKNDLELLIKQHSKKTYETHYYTTMFDLYALPDNFPNYKVANKIADCYKKVEKLEEEFAKDINSAKFIPYIQLHEFEALVFCGLEHLLVDYPDMTKQVENLKKIVASYSNNTEKINNNPATAPSKRIIKEFEKFHHYDKPKSGEFVTDKVGIEALKDKCPHFKEWIEKLEKLSEE
ncbi:hypothetical protein AGMMS49574_05760 [Bacteroidia bacterium]|nr:hypothetical protein AGMMS49574_05760 [Bacteroidia bacterium]GHU55350.1 hypothetical protein FACS189411_03620 [Bacteroidia bacterium]